VAGSRYTIKALEESSWDAFASLVEANNGVFGGCWCMGFHPDDGRDPALNRERKLARVRAGAAHAALVFDGDDCVGWCQFGAPDEVPKIKNRAAYEKSLSTLPDWRIACTAGSSRKSSSQRTSSAVPAVWERFEASLWATTSLLVVAERESLVVDPAISVDEVASIAGRALEIGAPVRHVLITHGHWDHVCGIGAFPDAVVAMAEETAEEVRSGAAAESVRKAAAAYGVAVPGSPRVDQAIALGSAVSVGPFAVETFPLVGHSADGSGFRIREHGLLIVGDHLSAVEFPFVTSPAAYRSTLAGLIEMLRADPPGTVIPGHGPTLTVEEALSIAEADLAYLRSLHAAVLDSFARGGTREEARAAGLAVELPRPCAPDLEEMRGHNVERQIEEIFA
jgi:glyoxylase-like metal-dependent hydrolase (beta-lactamase superfamily II)